MARARQTAIEGAPWPTERPLAEVRFLTVAEVAAIMRVSKMTVYRLVHAGELPAVRVGRSFRVPEDAVHDYLRRRRSSTPPDRRHRATASRRGVAGPRPASPAHVCGAGGQRR